MKINTAKILIFIREYWFLIALLCSAVYSTVTLYNEVINDRSEMDNIRILHDKSRVQMKQDIEVLEGRMDKRHKRELESLEKIEGRVEHLERSNIELTKELYYLKGKNDGEN